MDARLEAYAQSARAGENMMPALIGLDNDPQALATARANARRAGIPPELIAWQLADVRQPPPGLDLPPNSNPLASGPGWIVTNPPYGQRLEATDDSLWRDWSSQLKRHFGGWQLAIISSDTSLPQRLRLKPRLRMPVYNGALDCRLFLFDLAAAGIRV